MQELEENHVRITNEKIGERLSEIRKITHPALSQEEFSQKFKIEPRTKLSKIERGKQGISVQDLLIYIEKLSVNANWILTGKGDRFQNQSDYKMLEDPKEVYEKSELKKEIDQLKEKIKVVDKLSKKIEELEKTLSNLKNENL